jgi:hypothetical protein
LQPAGLSHYQRSKGLRWSERLDIVSPLLSSCEPLLALRRQLAGLMNDASSMGRCWLQHAKLCRATGAQQTGIINEHRLATAVYRFFSLITPMSLLPVENHRSLPGNACVIATCRPSRGCGNFSA